MKLSTRSRYGARILVDIARNYQKGPVQVGEIAKRQNISVKYLEQLIRPLRTEKLISSIRGPKGGYIMARKPEEISLGQILRIYEGHNDLVACVSQPESCERSDECRLRRAWKDAATAMREKLDATSIADLINGE